MLESYVLLRESVYASLAMQTRLAPYLDAIGLVIDANGIGFDLTGFDARLEGRRADSPRDAMWDLIDLNRLAGATLLSVNYDGTNKLRQWVQELALDSPLRAELPSMNVLLAGTVVGGTAHSDIYIGDAGANVFNAAAGDDLLDGGDGSDKLSGGDGNDLLRGGAGADTLSGGNGDDLLQGGSGNDTINGGLGNNTYVFGIGDGQDVIEHYWDATPDKYNVLKFGPGIDPSQIVARRVYDAAFVRYDAGNTNALYAALELSIAGTADKITVRGAFDYDNPGNPYNALQGIEFADGTVWGLEQIVARTLQSTEEADTLRGTLNSDVIHGGSGNDSISGGNGDDTIHGEDGNDAVVGDNGNDTLFGGTGNDSLTGGNGNDTLEGGAGNDLLQAGLGNNTYVFGIGDGQDVIEHYWDAAPDKFNLLKFGPGIDPSQIVARRVYDAAFVRYDAGNTNALYAALELSIAGTADKITVRGAFDYDNPGNPYNALQGIEFADGTVWGLEQIVARTLQSTDGADTLRGTLNSDVIHGGSGNDTLGGGAGDDDLHGGDGNDAISGDSGNDLVLRRRRQPVETTMT